MTTPIAVLLAIASSTILAARPARADETIFKISLNARQKQSLVTYMQKRIARHQTMAKEAIIDELRAEMADKSSDPEYAKLVSRTVDELKTFESRDDLVLLEKAELRQLLTSSNYVFYLSRQVLDRMDRNGPYPSFAETATGTLSLILTVPLDIVSLPITLILTAVTGRY